MVQKKAHFCHALQTTWEMITFFNAGEFIAMSIVYGGPGPRCFGPPLYDALTKGVTQANVCLKDVYDFDLWNSLQALKNTTSVQGAQKLISDHNLETVLELAGTLQILRKQEDILNLVDKTAHWFGKGPCSIWAIQRRATQLRVLIAIPENYDKLKEVFSYSEVTLTAELFGFFLSIIVKLVQIIINLKG